MTIDDVLSLSPKFWQLHNDPICLLDGAAFTLLTIQFNLCAGTIARYARRRPELSPLVEDFLRFRKQYVSVLYLHYRIIWMSMTLLHDY